MGGGKVMVHIILNTGVSSITVNGTSYTSSTDIEVKSGEVLNWSATAATGYNLSEASGVIKAEKEDVTISPVATTIEYTITITKNTGVNRIVVNGYGTYYNSTSIKVPYGTYISWTAYADDNYAVNPSSGSFTVTGNASIAPTAKMQYITLTVNNFTETQQSYLQFYNDVSKIGTYGAWFTQSSIKASTGGQIIKVWVAEQTLPIYAQHSFYCINYVTLYGDATLQIMPAGGINCEISII